MSARVLQDYSNEPGAYAMSITPFDSKGAVDEGILREHLRYLAAAGVGVYLGSYGTGEGPFLTREEMHRVYLIGAEELKGKVPAYAAGHSLVGTQTVIDAAWEATSVGLDAFYLYGPRRHPAGDPTFAEIETYFVDVLTAIELPVILANNTSVTGYEIPVGILSDLVDKFEHVAAVASAHFDYSYNEQLISAISGKVPVDISIGGQWLKWMGIGGRGLLSPDPNVAPVLCRSVFRAFQKGDITEAQKSFAVMMKLSAGLAKYRNPKAQKVALGILGRPAGYLRRPHLPLDSDARTEIALLLEELDVKTIEGIS